MTCTGSNITAAEQAIQQSGVSTSADGTVATIDATINNFADHGDLYNSVGSLVSKLDIFVSAMDILSQVSVCLFLNPSQKVTKLQIHSYANFAWRLASTMYKTIKHQFEVDKKVVELVQAMRDAFDFVDQVDTLRDKTHKVEAVIIQLSKQTNECCLFIQEYARHNFASTLIHHRASTSCLISC
ncbi:uncharacterized protein FOMMEDRAFT_171027 [Fomitiporia mediterranea MF3/22]|uniref:uncharacterized protein n=1 Tax=Fomitiporia mediterranea (strain MF3/22) TaxID=694068 RepID=UPI00044073DF|nr:uncharacterized protein FOMMEDRAFT_171027 [Fomitiporia mediterranea MF3/22]EJC98363.1 hypothetical protein FOMMEDRAFT_171027 [Fomitiporia mediterranea MF3/22]